MATCDECWVHTAHRDEDTSQVHTHIIHKGETINGTISRRLCCSVAPALQHQECDCGVAGRAK